MTFSSCLLLVPGPRRRIWAHWSSRAQTPLRSLLTYPEGKLLSALGNWDFSHWQCCSQVKTSGLVEGSFCTQLWTWKVWTKIFFSHKWVYSSQKLTFAEEIIFISKTLMLYWSEIVSLQHPWASAWLMYHSAPGGAPRSVPSEAEQAMSSEFSSLPAQRRGSACLGIPEVPLSSGTSSAISVFQKHLICPNSVGRPELRFFLWYVVCHSKQCPKAGRNCLSIHEHLTSQAVDH